MLSLIARRSLLEARDRTMSDLSAALKGDKRDMVVGIAEIVRQVRDPENRYQIAAGLVRKFKREGIEFDYNLFTAACEQV